MSWINPEPWMEIKLGYKTYSVVKAECDDGKFLGQVIHGMNTIYIEKTACKQEQFNTLLHEIIHSCLKLGGLDPILEEAKLEEAIVENVANGLTDLLMRNSHFVNFLFHQCQIKD